MTRRECYDRARETSALRMDDDTMRRHLAELEERLTLHGLRGEGSLPPFTPEEDDAPLSAPDAFGELFVRYLVSRAYLALGDVARFECFHRLYREALDDYAAYHCRTYPTPSATLAP